MAAEQEKTARPRGTDSARVIQVIETRAIEGRGTAIDPCRTLIQYWKMDENLLTKLYENGGRYEEQEEPVRPRGTDSAKVIQLIETRSIEGRGTPDDPCRVIIQYWETDGNLLTERYED